MGLGFQRFGFSCQCSAGHWGAQLRGQPALGSQSLQSTSSCLGGPGRCGHHQGSVPSCTAPRDALRGRHSWKTGSVVTHLCCRVQMLFPPTTPISGPSCSNLQPDRLTENTSSDNGTSKINNLSVAVGSSQPGPEPAAFPGDHGGH